MSTITYRGCTITWDPKPGPRDIAPDWSWVHPDHDGAPDGVSMCGAARSVEACKAEIDELLQWLENEGDE